MVTYCLAIRIDDGLVALADGRVTSGNQLGTARKLTLHGSNEHRFFVAASGLRSLRDKTVTFLDRELARLPGGVFPTMFDTVEAFARHLRHVAEQDKAALTASELDFNLHALVGGMLAEDDRPHAYLVYPEGNWIEVDERSCYLTIGSVPYGKPVLDRALRHDTDLRTALKLAYLSFDSTRASAVDVGFPIDVATFSISDRRWREAQYDYDDVREQRTWWNDGITRLARAMPDEPFADRLLPPNLSLVSGRGSG